MSSCCRVWQNLLKSCKEPDILSYRREQTGHTLVLIVDLSVPLPTDTQFGQNSQERETNIKKKLEEC